MGLVVQYKQAVEKLRCRFTQPVPWFSTPFFVSLRTLWAYGFDSAARRAPEKSKVGES